MLQVIGQGAMGCIIKARHRGLQRVVALKTILSGTFATKAEVRRFQVEAAAALDHPNLVPVYEVGEYRGHHYDSMKFIEGPDLSRRIGKFRDDPEAAARFMITVAQAVHYAHQRGILHRDLKPRNILLDGGSDPDPARWRPMVADFGLAKRLDGDSQLTMTGTIDRAGRPFRE